MHNATRRRLHQPFLAAAIPRRSNATRPVGPVTFLVLRALQQLPPASCYGARIEEHLSDNLRELVGLAQVYICLKRCKTRALITAKYKKQRAPDGTTRTVKVYSLTAKGKQAIASAAVFYRRVAETTRQP